MKQHSITVKKTARYFQLGTFSENTKTVILACHGYGQLANYFLKWFEGIDLTHTVIIAPEGLHRFYWDGFSGKVVASWMTKEDREDDIKDYVLYLDDLVDQLPSLNKYQLLAFGFSQGAATITRWVAHTNHSIAHLILWAGVFPEDVSFEDVKNKTKSPVQVLFGDKDNFYDLEAIEKVKKKLLQIHSNFTFTQFEGTHKVYLEPLNNLLRKLEEK